MNAFECGDDLIVDLAAYPDNHMLAQLHRSNMLFGLDPMDASVPTRCLTIPNIDLYPSQLFVSLIAELLCCTEFCVASSATPCK